MFYGMPGSFRVGIFFFELSHSAASRVPFVPIICVEPQYISWRSGFWLRRGQVTIMKPRGIWKKKGTVHNHALSQARCSAGFI